MTQLTDEQRLAEVVIHRDESLGATKNGVSRAALLNMIKTLRTDIDFLLLLLDSDSQAAEPTTSNLLRRLKDFLFENCDHSDRDRNYDWCPSCVMVFMEVVARPSNTDAATRMRDKCREVMLDYFTLNASQMTAKYGTHIPQDAIQSLTLDQVEQEKLP